MPADGLASSWREEAKTAVLLGQPLGQVSLDFA